MQVPNEIKNLNIDCSPSYLFNNLTGTKSSLYFIHNSESLPRIILVHKKMIQERIKTKCVDIFNSSEQNEMIFVKALSFNEGDYIAVGLYNGFKLWNADGSRLLFQISEPKINQNKIYAMLSCSGFELFDNNSGKGGHIFDSILVGDNYGQLFLIHGTKSNWKSRKIYSTSKCESIISIGSFPGYKKIGMTLDNGSAIILSLDNGECSLVKEFKSDIDSSNISTNCVVLCNNNNNNKDYFLCCGYINGMIKIFDMDKQVEKFKISSNLRNIGSMIVIKENEIVVGSDDGQVIVWGYNPFQDKMVLVRNFILQDKMIVGLCYNYEKNELYVNAFDSPEISIIEQI